MNCEAERHFSKLPTIKKIYRPC